MKRIFILLISVVLAVFSCDYQEGPRGLSSLLTVTDEPPGITCSNGGKRVDNGIDKNENGVLDPSEIASTNYVCNSVDGLTSLINVKDEGAGTNCGKGGSKVESGIDKNRNDILDSEEIEITKYICNGMDGQYSLITISREENVQNCAAGGVKIDSGIDLNRNQTLDDDEIQLTKFVCDGEGHESQIRLRITDPIGFGLASPTLTIPTSQGPRFSLLPLFSKNTYLGADSILFVVVGVRTYDGGSNDIVGKAEFQLLDVTYNEVISSSKIETDDSSIAYSVNIMTQLPNETVELGIKCTGNSNFWTYCQGTYLFIYH